MKITLISLAFLSLTGLVYAQEKGIKFEQGSSWSQIKMKAKAENKYIFMDVFATWCGPCKAMDADVYPAERLGLFFNDKFISVKVQADTTSKDDEHVKKWYKDAHQIIRRNKVSVFPTLLFFSPEGELIDRGIGYNNAEHIIQLASSAIDPKKQYYSMLNSYRSGNMDYKNLPEVIKKARSLNEDSLADAMTDDYLRNYLNKLPEEDLLTKQHLLFVALEGGDSFTSDSRIFQFIYKNPGKADVITGNKGFAKSVINWRITKEELYNKLWKKNDQPFTKNPDWNRLKTSIKEKYNEFYADSLITPVQFYFYESEKNWVEYVKLAELTIKRYPPKKNGRELSTAIGGIALKGPGNDAWGLNGIAWKLFLNTKDVFLLKKALLWSGLSIKLEDPKSLDAHQNYDTKAQILYKLGRLKEAVEWEKKGIEVLQDGKKDASYREYYINKYTDIISKMIKGEKIWQITSSNL